MASPYEAEVTVISAKDLKNVNWRHGSSKPYAVVWVDPSSKSTTRVDEEGDTSPHWGQTFVIPLNAPLEDSTLYIDVVHARKPEEEDTKPLIGSGWLLLRGVIDDVGLGGTVTGKLELRRPCGRPQGKIDVKVNVREPRHRALVPYHAPSYGVLQGSRDFYYSAPAPSGTPYAASYPAAPPSANPYDVMVNMSNIQGQEIVEEDITRNIPRQERESESFIYLSYTFSGILFVGLNIFGMRVSITWRGGWRMICMIGTVGTAVGVMMAMTSGSGVRNG